VVLAAAASLSGCALVAGLGVDYRAAADAPADASQAEGWCARQATHAFCSDFDEGPPGTGWDGTDVAGGTLELSGDHAVSPPSALGATVPSGTSVQTTGARVEAHLPAATKRITLDLEAFVDQRPDRGEVTLLTIQMPDANEYGVRVKLGQQQTRIGLSTHGTYSELDAKNIPFGSPFHLEVVINIGGEVLFRYFDGQGDSQTVFSATPSGPLLLKLGMLASPQNGPGRAYFDNVTVDVE